MPTTVFTAFSEFLKNYVRIDSGRNDVALASKKNLVNEIIKFPDGDEFPPLHPEQSMDYGSYSRRTKIRPLDDIDIMIILNAQSSTYIDTGAEVEVHIHPDAKILPSLCYDDTLILNSIKVNNLLKEHLKGVTKYSKAEIKRNQEAVTLNLESYEWVYDIVPAMKATGDGDSTFYLIPDGKGNWKRTDPRVDKKRTISTNDMQNVSVLDMVRLVKFWAKNTSIPEIKSYFLENLILNYYRSGVASFVYEDIEMVKVFAYIYHNIHNSLNDPKGFQGDINHLSYEEREKVKVKAGEHYFIAVEARNLEGEKKMEESIAKWRLIFGESFPKYL
ncbi:hypothetical protein [Pedobacter sp. R-06]|uniref:hypothetical protein n=1 Tax=Pedobacter sp. R-06 TaxID=3404051 RepID=UPI003CE9AC69